MAMRKYTLYMSERIIVEFGKLNDKGKGEFIRRAVHFYLDYHEQIDEIITKLDRIDSKLTGDVPIADPASADATDDDDSILDILNMGDDAN